MATNIQIIVRVADILSEIQAARNEVAAAIKSGQGTWPRKNYIKNDRWHHLHGELLAYEAVLCMLHRLVTVATPDDGDGDSGVLNRYDATDEISGYDWGHQ